MAPTTRRSTAKSAQDMTPSRTSSSNKIEKPKSSSSAESGEKGTEPQGKINNQSSYWLMKAEPESRLEKGVDVKFSIDDLAAAQEPEGWDARNNMRAMKKGDQAFFYHSNCKTPGIVGTMEIVREHTVDGTAQDPNHPYYDPKENSENPKWSMVHVEFRKKFPQIISLKNLQKFKGPGQTLESMQVLRQSRLSVSKVSKEEWDFVLELAEQLTRDGVVD